MTIKKRCQPFTQVDNKLVNDTRLSMQAVGLFVYLWSKPNDWQYIKEQLVKRFNIGRDGLNSALKLLEDCNYLYKQCTRGEAGKFTHSKWILSDTGNARELANNPLTDNPLTDNPLTANPQLVILNKQRLNKQRLNHKSELDSFCDEMVISLKEILGRKLNRTIATSNWNKEIKLIVNNDLKIRGEQQARQDLIRCIQAVENHYGKEYFPVIQSAKSLREKFIKIENYIERSPEAKKDKLEKYSKQIEAISQRVKAIEPLASIQVKDKKIIINISCFNSLTANSDNIENDIKQHCKDIDFEYFFTNQQPQND